MSRGVARAMADAVSREFADADLDLPGRSLANARRRKVFRYMCLRPCARIGDIGRDLSMSQATVRWHTWDLVEHEYLAAEGTRIYPPGLIASGDAALFSALASPGRGPVLLSAIESPGISLQDLAEQVHLTRQSVSKVARELSAFGLLTLGEDGRYRRVHATDLLVRKRESNRSRAGAFADGLVRRLADEGLTPERLRQDEATLLVRFGAGTHRVLLEVPLDPYATAWARTA